MLQNVRNQNGWLLIDSLVGIIFVAVAICGIAIGYRQVSVAAKAASDYNDAVILAQQAAEQLKILNANQTTISTFNATIPIKAPFAIKNSAAVSCDITTPQTIVNSLTSREYVITGTLNSTDGPALPTLTNSTYCQYKIQVTYSTSQYPVVIFCAFNLASS